MTAVPGTPAEILEVCMSKVCSKKHQFNLAMFVWIYEH